MALPTRATRGAVHPSLAGRYRAVLSACCLGPDLEQWIQGDGTHVGDAGSLLSVGQRFRVCLARAVYARPKVLLADDCLSALDPRVGAHVLEHVFGPRGVGLLPGCTRVLVSHSAMARRLADVVVWMRDGRAVAEGSEGSKLLREAHPLVLQLFAQTTEAQGGSRAGQQQQQLRGHHPQQRGRRQREQEMHLGGREDQVPSLRALEEGLGSSGSSTGRLADMFGGEEAGAMSPLVLNSSRLSSEVGGSRLDLVSDPRATGLSLVPPRSIFVDGIEGEGSRASSCSLKVLGTRPLLVPPRRSFGDGDPCIRLRPIRGPCPCAGACLSNGSERGRPAGP